MHQRHHEHEGWVGREEVGGGSGRGITGDTDKRDTAKTPNGCPLSRDRAKGCALSSVACSAGCRRVEEVREESGEGETRDRDKRDRANVCALSSVVCSAGCRGAGTGVHGRGAHEGGGQEAPPQVVRSRFFASRHTDAAVAASTRCAASAAAATHAAPDHFVTPDARGAGGGMGDREEVGGKTSSVHTTPASECAHLLHTCTLASRCNALECAGDRAVECE